MYIDAGSGSMLFQAAVAILISGMVFFRQIAAKIKKIFTRREQKDDQSPENKA
jgi:hypothetical protein